MLPSQLDCGIRIGDGRNSTGGGDVTAYWLGNHSMAAKNALYRRPEPDWRGVADAFALSAERLVEIIPGLKIDANPRRNSLHRFDGSPFRYRQEMLARHVAAQQNFLPVEPLQRLRDTLGGCDRLAVDAVVGIDRCPDRRRSQAQSDDKQQSRDELKHNAHAIIPTNLRI